VQAHNSVIRSTSAPAPRMFIVALLALVLAAGGAVTNVAEAQASTVTRSRTAKNARIRGHRAKHVAARRARSHRSRAKTVSRSLPQGWRSAKVSWYGPGFYGHGMAGGGTLTKGSLVLAHKTLPFGTMVEVSYKGKTVVAPVMDRGPFVAGREFDLGPAVANALNMFSVATVTYRIVGR
jgi:rare lipoprotein A (peptidoglycan hydrolase)